MVFDLRTSEAARDFVLEFLGITKTDLAMTFALECEGDVDTLIDVLWKKYFDMIDAIDINNLKIMAFHITASLDNCAEVRENGLINLQKVLSEDTVLRRFLNKNGITFDISARKMRYKQQVFDIDYDRYKGRFDLSEQEKKIEKIAHRVFYDYCIDAFMVCDDVFNYSTIHEYPEFVLKIVDAFPETKALANDWAKRSKPYRVDFYVYYSQLHEFTFDFGETQYSPHDIYQELTYEQSVKKWMLSYAITRTYGGLSEVCLYVKDNIDVPSEQILSCMPLITNQEQHS